MNGYRHFQITGTDGGPLPPHPRLKVGAILRVTDPSDLEHLCQWNDETGNWVAPLWTEVEDPRKAVRP